MILLLTLAVAVAVALLVASRHRALPRPVVRAAAADVVEMVRHTGAEAYQFVLKGPGGRDVGDHDRDKLIVHGTPRPDGSVLVRVAPVDRRGELTGAPKRYRVVRAPQTPTL